MKETIYAIGYARISDQKQNTGSSLEIQDELITLHTVRNGWSLFPKGKVIKEIVSGRKMHVSQRPEYIIARKLILENPNIVKYFVISKIDRSTRAGSEEYMWLKNDLASIGVELRDTQNIIQPTINTLEHRGVTFAWSKKSPSQLTEIIVAEAGKDEVSNILTRTVDTSILRIETGYKLREANYGYKNQVIVGIDGQEKTIQVRNTTEAPHIEAIFEKTIEGTMTEQEIVDYVNALGYKSRLQKRKDKIGRIIGYTGGNKLEIKQMQKYRKNAIYCGVNIETWGDTQKRTIISKTQYKGLVSIEVFNKANKGKVYIEEISDNKVKVLYDLQLNKVIKKRQKFRTEYVFKNVVLCDICKAPLLASRSKSKSGKYVSYYHCQRKHKYFAVPQKELDKTMMQFLSTIKFSDKYYKVFEQVLTWRYNKEQEKSLDAQVIVDENILRIKNQIKQNLDAYKSTTNQSMKLQFQADYEQSELELSIAKIERQKLELDYDDLIAFLKYARNLMEHPIEMFLDICTYNEQMALYKILFNEFPSYSELVSGTPKVSLFFKVGIDNLDDKSLDVTLQSLEWNTLQSEVIRWNEILYLYPFPLREEVYA